MKEYRTWHEILMEQLADYEAAIDYLQVTLEEYQVDRDTQFFLQEIKTVVEAQGGITDLAKRIGIAPEVISKVLASEESPRVDMFHKILRGLGCRLSIELLENVDHTDETVIPLPESENPTFEGTTESSELR